MNNYLGRIEYSVSNNIYFILYIPLLLDTNIDLFQRLTINVPMYIYFMSSYIAVIELTLLRIYLGF